MCVWYRTSTGTTHNTARCVDLCVQPSTKIRTPRPETKCTCKTQSLKNVPVMNLQYPGTWSFWTLSIEFWKWACVYHTGLPVCNRHIWVWTHNTSTLVVWMKFFGIHHRPFSFSVSCSIDSVSCGRVVHHCFTNHNPQITWGSTVVAILLWQQFRVQNWNRM